LSVDGCGYIPRLREQTYDATRPFVSTNRLLERAFRHSCAARCRVWLQNPPIVRAGNGWRYPSGGLSAACRGTRRHGRPDSSPADLRAGEIFSKFLQTRDGWLPVRRRVTPPMSAFYPVPVRRLRVLPPASSPPHLARQKKAAPPGRWAGGRHEGHETRRGGERSRASGSRSITSHRGGEVEAIVVAMAAIDIPADGSGAANGVTVVVAIGGEVAARRADRRGCAPGASPAGRRYRRPCQGRATRRRNASREGSGAAVGLPSLTSVTTTRSPGLNEPHSRISPALMGTPMVVVTAIGMVDGRDGAACRRTRCPT
jgi:hypothetical protein